MSIESRGRGRGRPRTPVSGTKPLAVTIQDTRRIIGLGNTKVYELIKDGLIETRKVGTRTLVIYASLERLLGIGST